MKKKPDPIFSVGDILCVSEPTSALNIKMEEESTKFDIDEVILVGDEALIVSEIEYKDKSKEYIYKLLVGEGFDSKEFSIGEGQLMLYGDN